MKIKGYGSEIVLIPENDKELRDINDFFIEMQDSGSGNGSAKAVNGKVQIIKTETHAKTEFSINLD